VYEVETTPAALTKRPPRLWRLALGILILLLAAVNSVRRDPPTSMAGALGAVTDVLISFTLSFWLISTGIGKAIGDRNFTRSRRIIWFRFLAFGFLVLLAIAASSVTLEVPPVEVTTVCVFAYWFGWTWIAWILAERSAVGRSRTQDAPNS
jgi:hypothetical protein